MHKINIISLITHFLFLQQSGTDFNVPPVSRIALSHIFWDLYQSGTYLITNDNFLAAFLHMFTVLRWSETNLSICGFYIIPPILIFEDLSTILYKLKEKR